MKQWVVGVNEPGVLPTNQPRQFDTWERAWHFLCEQLEWAMLDRGPNADTTYDTAREQVLMAREDTPLSVFTFDLVWWLADVG